MRDNGELDKLVCGDDSGSIFGPGTLLGCNDSGGISDSTSAGDSLSPPSGGSGLPSSSGSEETSIFDLSDADTRSEMFEEVRAENNDLFARLFADSSDEEGGKEQKLPRLCGTRLWGVVDGVLVHGERGRPLVPNAWGSGCTLGQP